MIVGLMVTYNEHHFITYSLPILREITDCVVVLDASNDGTCEYLERFDNVHVFYEEHYGVLSYQERRQLTLDLGRMIGGTHFVCVDGDEVMSVDLAHTIKNILPLLPKGHGISCNWYHIINNLYTRSDSIDCSVQSIAWVDDYYSGLMGRNAIHEDKFPPGHPMQSPSLYTHINKPLLHFGGVDHTYFIQKRMYYKCIELLDTHDVNTTNLTYFRKLDDHPIQFFCNYPANIDNGILHGPPNNKFIIKLHELLINNNEIIDELYMLDIWRYHDSIIEYCEKYVDGFDRSKIRYTKNIPDWVVHLDMTIRQTVSLIVHGKVNRILLYMYRCVIWRLYGSANSSY